MGVHLSSRVSQPPPPSPALRVVLRDEVQALGPGGPMQHSVTPSAHHASWVVLVWAVVALTAPVACTAPALQCPAGTSAVAVVLRCGGVAQAGTAPVCNSACAMCGALQYVPLSVGCQCLCAQCVNHWHAWTVTMIARITGTLDVHSTLKLSSIMHDLCPGFLRCCCPGWLCGRRRLPSRLLWQVR